MNRKELLFLFCVGASLYGTDDETFYGYKVSMLQNVYNKSDQYIHQIVDTLNGQAGINTYSDRYAIFEGEPGSGKSLLAVAIACMTKRTPVIRSAGNFIKGSRGKGTAALDLFFETAKTSHGKKVLIIEEINYLLQNYKSEHHDTDGSSMLLWTMLDQLPQTDKRKKIFFIGTMNGMGGLPPQLESRWQDTLLTINSLYDADVNIEDIKKGLEVGAPVIDQEVYDFFEGNKEQFGKLTYRDIERLVRKIRAHAYKKDQECHITIDDVHAGIERISYVKKKYKEETKESDLEQRERHHKEAMKQNKEGINKSTLIGTIGCCIAGAGLVVAAAPVAGPALITATVIAFVAADENRQKESKHA